MSTNSSALLSAYHHQVSGDIAILLAEHDFRADGPMLSSSEGVTVSSGAGVTRVTFHEPTSYHGMGIVDFTAGTSPAAIAAVATALHTQARSERQNAEPRASVGTRMGQDDGIDQPIAVVRLSQDAVSIDANPANPPARIVDELLGDNLTDLRVTVSRDGVWVLAESSDGDPEFVRAWTPRHLRDDHDAD